MNRKTATLIVIVSRCFTVALFLPQAWGEDPKIVVNKPYGYQFEAPAGLIVKVQYNGEIIEMYENDKIAMRITAFGPNPKGSIAYGGEIKRSDDLTLQERIAVELYQVCRPPYGTSDPEFLQAIDWSYPLVGGEAAVQANGTSWKGCDSRRFPVTMVRKGDLRFRFNNFRLDREAFERVLSSFLFIKREDSTLPATGGK
ncbi:hypothetical protein [Desulfobacca acetoxidans]|uniref:Uncharacterized protein n=1 Tax=Desulfobacca acetoxidans (strain ATCC 700848 / DSM 11109 / ASRB2) TaxID=880072 RepID=F2NC88_DESAR|nr:hypothetical protein [Desulfobacca acetoxidans]AEB08883.1 hypothetical protein Desac_1016 [Desulfobacca acetoxidans DSM 11109]